MKSTCRSKVVRAVLSLFLSVLGACASSAGSYDVIHPLAADVELSDYDGLIITASRAPGVEISPRDMNRILRKVEREIAKEVPGRFACITTVEAPDAYELDGGDPASTLHANLHFTRYDPGSAIARFWLAGLGQIHIDAELELEDYQTERRLAEYEVTKTFAWGGLYGEITRIWDVEVGFVARIADLVILDKLHGARSEAALSVSPE